MPDTLPPPVSKPLPRAPVSRVPRRSWFSPIWIIPLVSALLGLWLIARHYSGQGPKITVRLETAEGIIAGKTPVLCRSVHVGTVSEVKLTHDLKGVIVTLAMTRDATPLLVQDSQIWVVRARYSAAGISGLSTLVSGNYIELQPGVVKAERREFVGLENPPPTPPGMPGLRFKLVADQTGGLGPGASILYKGMSVGKIETSVFRHETGKVEFTAFIDGQFSRLVNEKTRFYNSGGLDLKIGADGVQLRTGTLESFLTSSVTFTEPDAKKPRARQLADGRVFVLYNNFGDTSKVEFNPTLPYLLLFTSTVRGLSPDAPVEFRGIRVGSVDGASFKYLPGDPEHRVPVLIKIDPGVLVPQLENNPEPAKAFLAQSVENGLRATLKSGSLLTGQLFVELDFVKDTPPAAIVSIGGYDVLPTLPAAGLDELQTKAGELLDKFKALPIEKTVDNATEALASVKGAAANLDKLTSPGGSLDKTLKNAEKVTGELSGNKDIAVMLHNLRVTSDELKAAGANLTEATDTVKRQPWRLVWPSTKKYPEGATPSPTAKSTTIQRKPARTR